MNEQLAAWRTKRGLRQHQLANKIDRTQGLISQYESGEVTPPSEVLQDIAETYGISLTELLERDPDDESGFWSLMRTMRTATEDEIAQVIAVANVVVKPKR